MDTSNHITYLVPPAVVGHLIAAVAQEVAELERVGRACGDNWPDDYDPNDLAIYRGLLTWLSSGATDGITIEGSLTSKPMEFLMLLVPRYVHNNRASISESDTAAIFRAYVEYIALLSLEQLPKILEYPRSSYTDWLKRRLLSLVNFPSRLDT